MSVDLCVPLTRRMHFSDLLPEIGRQYQMLLRIDETVTFKCDQLEHGRRTSVSPSASIDASRVYLLRENDSPDVEVEMLLSHNLYELAEIFPNASQYASISVRAAGGESRRMVLGAASAIALAVLNETAIVDAIAWTEKYVSSPSELVQQLQVRSKAKTLIEASSLFCSQLYRSRRDRYRK